MDKIISGDMTMYYDNCVTAFKNSKSHIRNMLGDWDKVGIGITENGYSGAYVQHFIN